MLGVNVKDLKRLTGALKDINKRGLPHAVRNSLNTTAFETRKTWQRQIEQDFVTRNRYTTRSVRVEKAKGVKLTRLQAKVGSVAPYMAKQERGATIRGGKHKPIPTSAAAGQRGASPRTKTIRRPNYLGSIHLKRARGRTREQRNAVAIAQARRGSKYALIETDRGKALVRVMGRARKRTTRARKRKGGNSQATDGRTLRGQIRMLYDLSRGSVRVKPTPTLQRSLNKMGPRMMVIHRDSLVEQIERALRTVKR